MVEPYAFRQAVLDDLQTIGAQRRAMFTEMGVDAAAVARQDEPFRRWAARLMREGQFVTWFALSDGVIVAGAGVWIHDWLPGINTPDGVRGYICNVYTNPVHRGQGLARQLVLRCIEECRSRQVLVVALHASDAGRPVYEQLGFTQTNEMRLALKP
ncbi:MAG: GNAT family N-acetyltransferase [Anaerolineae bacterium]|nr:GNAT family N-acetyltransferase [Anaerolineae bacterium]